MNLQPWTRTRSAAIAALTLLALVVSAPGLADTPPQAAAPAEREMTILSKVYTVDQIYRSMKGPQSQQRIQLGDSTAPELLWITGYRAVMVGTDGEERRPQEYMCHSNLDINVSEHHQAVKPSHGFNPRLFTLSQGQLQIDFPEGFGIPILSTESLSLTTQVLNLNEKGKSVDVRHRVSVEYRRDQELDEGDMIPLFPVGAYGLVSLEEDPAVFGIRSPLEDMHGPGCLPGQNAAGHEYKDGLGQRFSGHWVVPPGRETNRTNVTQLMRLPYDTTVHYIAVHLHPFAESIALRDLTTGETVFASKARNFEDKIGLLEVEYFTSIEGVPLFKNHQYEMVTVYNNTTDEEQDSMAVMYLYLRDKMFNKARLELPPPAAPGATPLEKVQTLQPAERGAPVQPAQKLQSSGGME